MPIFSTVKHWWSNLLKVSSTIFQFPCNFSCNCSTLCNQFIGIILCYYGFQNFICNRRQYNLIIINSKLCVNIWQFRFNRSGQFSLFVSIRLTNTSQLQRYLKCETSLNNTLKVRLTVCKSFEPVCVLKTFGVVFTS